MSGICGYVGDHRPEFPGTMPRAIRQRGPDEMQAWTDAAAQVGPGHWLLSPFGMARDGNCSWPAITPALNRFTFGKTASDFISRRRSRRFLRFRIVRES